MNAFFQLLNCAALTGNCSILTRDKSFDLYISFSVSSTLPDPTPADLCNDEFNEPPWNPDAPGEPDEPPPPPPRFPTDVDDEAEDPGDDGSRGGFKGMLGWDACPLPDEGSRILSLGNFIVGVAMLKLSGIPAQADPDHTGLGAMGLGVFPCLCNCALNISVWRSCFNIWTSLDKSCIICICTSCIPVPLSKTTGSGATFWCFNDVNSDCSLRTVVNNSRCWLCWVSSNFDCDSNLSFKTLFSAIMDWSCCWEFWYAWFATVWTSDNSRLWASRICSRSWLALISTPLAWESAASTACWAWASIPWTCCSACCSTCWVYWLASLWISSTLWVACDSTAYAWAIAEAATFGSMPTFTCWCNDLWSYITFVVEDCCNDLDHATKAHKLVTLLQPMVLGFLDETQLVWWLPIDWMLMIPDPDVMIIHSWALVVYLNWNYCF